MFNKPLEEKKLHQEEKLPRPNYRGFRARIHSFDLASVKSLARKDKRLLEAPYLRCVFEQRYSRKRAWIRSHSTEESRLGLIASREAITIKLVRFLLKNGGNPNDEIFLYDFLIENVYHSRLFVRKLLQLCINNGLDVDFIQRFLMKHVQYDTDYKNHKHPFNRTVNRCYIRDAVRADDANAYMICKEWVSSFYKIRFRIITSKGTLQVLNDDVVSLIEEFL